MGFSFADLDERTRKYMLEELEMDITSGTWYKSTRLSEKGLAMFPILARSAIASGSEGSLADALRGTGILLWEEQRRTKNGTTIARVPVTAAETLAEGEYNRYYMRGLARRAIEDGIAALVVYRAKAVSNPRPDSQAKLGATVDPAKLLADLRANPGTDTALGLPAGPNSGLSVRLP